MGRAWFCLLATGCHSDVHLSPHGTGDGMNKNVLLGEEQGREGCPAVKLRLASNL